MTTPIDVFTRLVANADSDPAAVPVPSRLATAAGVSLHADGAAISLVSATARRMRMPIGFSGDDAAVAEELQFTIGDGPGLDAHRLGLPLLANPSTTTQCWPLFHEQLRERTAFRAVASLPLRHGPVTVGILDLYYNEPLNLATFPVDDAQAVADLAASRLVDEQYITDSSELGPAWLINHGNEPRGQVSVAMGILCLTLRVTADVALDLLRDHAERAGQTVDQVARHLTAGALSPQLLGGTGSERKAHPRRDMTPH